jgi:acetolactate synthase-1/2/3 large subunit
MSKTATGGEYVYEALREAGVELLVGLPGTQTLALDRVVAQRTEIDYVMARHETAIPHVAWGYYETSGRPAATLTVPGPGETNAMHGLKQALEDCVPILHVTGDASPDQRGKSPIHELEPKTYDTVVKENVIVESHREFRAAVDRGIERALTPPYGPVRLGLPNEFLAEAFAAPSANVEPKQVTRDNAAAYDESADLLADAKRPAIYAGGGISRSPGGKEALRSFAREVSAPVITTNKGKGTFPEDDSQFIGVAGGSLPPGARRTLERADVVLALGTDLDGTSTGNWTLPLGERLVHVTLDPADLDAGYEADVGIVADVADAIDAIRSRVDERRSTDSGGDRWDAAAIGTAVREEYCDHLRTEGLYEATTNGFHTPGVLRTVREMLPEETIVTTDVGGFRLWTMQAFPVTDPQRLVAAGSWAGMGVGLPAAIGAKLANPDLPVVCLSGDGGLLMCIHELATAIEENLNIVLIVSNNSDYGVISKKPEIRGVVDDHAFTWDSPNFSTIADGFGWTTEAVTDAAELEAALDAALDRDGPTLVDVAVPTDELSASEAADFETTLTF